MKNYFTECKTMDEAKNVFRKLCFKFHPDTSKEPNAQMLFVELKKQFDNFRPSKGFERNQKDTADNLADLYQYFNSLQEAYKIASVGSWIWINKKEAPETKEEKQEFFKSAEVWKVREEVKAVDYVGVFNWKRGTWQFKPKGSKHRKTNGTLRSLKDLQNFYGGKDINETRKRQEKRKEAIQSA